MIAVDLGGLTARWTGGGLFLRHGEHGLLLDAPAGVRAALGEELPRVHGIVLTGDRTRSVVGLFELLAGLAPHRRRDLPLALCFPLGAERGALLAETWVRGWPDRYPLTLDAAAPGARLDAGPFALHTLPLAQSEPAGEGLRRGVGMGLRVQAGDRSVAWIPTGPLHRHMGQLCDGVDLAVVEVGRAPWPRLPGRHRLSEAEAMEVGAGARQVWLPGDDGRLEAGMPA